MRFLEDIKLATKAVLTLLTKKAVPPAVRWDITPRCPLACEFCCARRKPEPAAEMDTDHALKFIDALGRAGVVTISFSGGEPLLREDLDLLARRARHWGIRPTVNTSGVLGPRCVERVRSMHLVKLSLDGPEDVHDKMRGQGVYRLALAALEAIKGVNVQVRIEATLTRSNCSVETASHLVELAKRYRTQVLFQVFHPHCIYEDVDRFTPTKAQVEEVADYIAYLWCRRERAIENAIYSIVFLRGRKNPVPLACTGGRLFVIADALGRLTPCDRMRPSPQMQWDGGEFSGQGLERVPSTECQGCAFSGSLTLNVVGNGPVGIAFAGEALLYEVHRAFRYWLRRSQFWPVQRANT